MDTQVVLSWILSRSVASKNIFVKNRLRDVLQMSGKLETQFGLVPSFKYVLLPKIQRTSSLEDCLNPTINFGPSWLSGGGAYWLVQELPCLSRCSQLVAHEFINNSIVLEEEYPSVIILDCLSGFAHLFRVATFILKFITRPQEQEEDCERKAMMKLLQCQVFTEELEFQLDALWDASSLSPLGLL